MVQHSITGRHVGEELTEAQFFIPKSGAGVGYLSDHTHILVPDDEHPTHRMLLGVGVEDMSVYDAGFHIYVTRCGINTGERRWNRFSRALRRVVETPVGYQRTRVRKSTGYFIGEDVRTAYRSELLDRPNLCSRCADYTGLSET